MAVREPNGVCIRDRGYQTPPRFREVSLEVSYQTVNTWGSANLVPLSLRNETSIEPGEEALKLGNSAYNRWLTKNRNATPTYIGAPLELTSGFRGNPFASWHVLNFELKWK